MIRLTPYGGLVSKEFPWLTILLAEGSLDILEFLKKNKMGQFKDLAKLENKRTKRTFSPNTVSARLNELMDMNALTSIPVKTQRKRVLAYQISEKGLQILDAAYVFEEKLDHMVKK